MAFTRKMLKAMGIDDEKIEQIIEAHAETVDALKAERDRFKADAEKLADVQTELDEAKAKIAKHGDGEVVPKKEFDDMKRQFDEYRSQQEAKETKAAKEHAFRELLRAAGISEKRLASIVKVSDLDSIELDEKGQIKDAEALTEAAKTEWSDFIETTHSVGARTATPPAKAGNGETKTKAEILAIRDPAARQAEIAKNPSLFGI